MPDSPEIVEYSKRTIAFFEADPTIRALAEEQPPVLTESMNKLTFLILTKWERVEEGRFEEAGRLRDREMAIVQQIIEDDGVSEERIRDIRSRVNEILEEQSDKLALGVDEC